ncbi:D-alanyl-D-alanine carboxypeptidase/D-alanyl-D-alanine-endopeptidase [Aliiroseovarius sp. F20344]|uniref:D-alanyl-D-alanine carboxypeptidase/D-alanyl-D-alanine endopeptidase n=1 Tax=Aliiroseovarius sp. F20344 TaxID=2926414 RepID=UPI001FF37995|nr:D-alanyl-D-alanine carboxypeptidase/D-alanyl-D-alanine-endopeptidase [Aliiroseovarius sp. F20344]MCK0143240.1 D-alanyl-D-alanine carboxypeptidase/D-alanyl-D-alanine-endopeptidase [Aliiroseovarius sp. F20344]
MAKAISRRVFLSGLGAGLASPVLANAPTTSLFPVAKPVDFAKRSLPSVDMLVDAAGLGGKLGFMVADARSGEVLEVRNPVLPLPPASVAKAITGAYALSSLGGGHRFETLLMATGVAKNGVIQGDLILVGGADPTLDTDGLAQMALDLKAQGVTGITGSFKVDGAYLPYQRVIDPGQPDHLGYNPSISGLNLNFNRVHFEWKRAGQGWDVAMDARSETLRPAVKVARMEVVDRKSPIFTYKDASGVDSWTVARTALGKGGSRWLPVRRPDIYAGEVFQVLARGQGINLPRPVSQGAATTGNVLTTYHSAPVSEIVQGMLKYSTNLTAEVVGMAASVEAGAAPADLPSSATAMSFWAKEALGTRRLSFVDHSGLSDQSQITARDMVRALIATSPDGDLAPLLKNVPPKSELLPDGGSHTIRAKTGTLNFVSSLAGYATTPNGRELAFAIFTADMERRSAIQRAFRERPQGARGWSRRSRRLQHDLIARWSVLFGT